MSMRVGSAASTATFDEKRDREVGRREVMEGVCLLPATFSLILERIEA